MKRLILFFIPIFTIAIAGCTPAASYRKAEGAVWGTVYHITYKSDRNLDDSIVAEMQKVNMSLSTFEPSSTISRVNAGLTDTVDELFADVYRAAAEVYSLSGGLYDPTVGPLVNLWGFGSDGDRAEPDKEKIDSALALVGFGRTRLVDNRVVCDTVGMRFDFASIAKGYGVDRVAEMLRRNGCTDFMVEVGGEISASGVNPKGEGWNIAIEQPVPESVPGEKMLKVWQLKDRCMATSGNYRNFKKRSDGTTYGHTINPLTGYPNQSELLSVTVIAPTCIQADALATALMTMTEAKLTEVIKSLPQDIEILYTVATPSGPEIHEIAHK